MVSEAIQTTLEGIITNTFNAMVPEPDPTDGSVVAEIPTPYCMHKESGDPQYVKEGICGYDYDCEILVVDDTADKVEALAMLIKSAMEALTGTTTKGTKIDLVVFEPDSPDADPESKLYYNILKFSVLTSNR